jgi:hypothetical protein
MNRLDPQPISNLGTPFENIDFKLVGDGTNYAGGFGSNEDPSVFGITPKFASNNVLAASASSLNMKGGSNNKKSFAKGIKRKMKIISNKYKKMVGKKISLKGIKRKFKSMFKTMKKNLKLQGGKGKMSRQMRRSRSQRRTRGRRQRGGYHQFMGNVARSYGYSVGGDLSSQELGLANPPPIERYSTGVDNYNHFTGKGAQIWN